MVSTRKIITKGIGDICDAADLTKTRPMCLLPDFGHFLGSTHDELVLASSPYPSLKGITFSYR